MIKKFLLIIVLSLLCTTNSFSFDLAFIEGGIGGRYIDGSIGFNSDSDSPSAQESTWGYNENANGFGWNNKFLWNLNLSIGTHLSENSATSLSFQYLLKKSGSNLFNVHRDTIVDYSQQFRNSIFDLSNSYHQINIRLSHSISLNSSFSFIGGLEYVMLKLERVDPLATTSNNLSGVIHEGTDFSNNSSYTDNTFGILAGLGYERSVSEQMSLITSGTYTFSKYNGDGLSFGGLELNLSGFELGLRLRYYIK